MDRVREIYRSEKKCQKVFNKHYIVGFWVTLSVAVGLLVTGFFMPPMAVIDGSILTAVGELMFWPAIAFGVKAVEDGRIAKLVLGNTQIQIGKDDNGNGLDDNYEQEIIENNEEYDA